MKRVNVGTDMALLGAWDYSRNDSPLSHPELKNLIKSLEKDCLQGHLFLIKTGADCGGVIDIYMDEEVPGKVKERTNEISQHFLISIPTGKLVVGGVEDYRSKNPKITGPDSIVTISPGDYRLKCFVGKDDEDNNYDYRDEDLELELEKLVGAKEIRYFDRVNNRGLLSGIIFSFLLFFLLVFTAGLPVALVVTVIVFLLYFHAFEWVFKRNTRYQRLKKIIPTFRIKHEQSIFVFELKKVVDVDKTGLKGGFIEL